MTCTDDIPGAYAYAADQLDPSIALNWLDSDRQPRDLSTYTGSVKFVDADGTVAHTKTTGFTLSATLPNFVISLDAGDMTALAQATETTYSMLPYATKLGRSSVFSEDNPMQITIGPF